ncbi:MAG: glycosyltransferase family 2 protein [Candidatus Saccharimonadaceae bacterium]
MSDQKVATIIVSWNNANILAECFDSLAVQTSADRNITILVDNGSKDESVQLTKEKYPWVEVIESGKNLGFAKGNNVAIDLILEKYPSVEYVILLNSDARLAPDWIETVYSFAKTKPKGAFFQSLTLDYYNPKIIDTSHIYIARNGAGTQANWRKLEYGELGPQRVFGVNFAAAMISCDFIREQPYKHLLDETMFMYLEDVDACARATVMGWENYTVPNTRAFHMGSASSNKRPGFSLYMTYRNNIALLVKNLPASMFIRIIPRMIRSDYHTMRHLRKRGFSSSIQYVIKGRIVGFLRLPLYSRQVIQMRKYRKTVSAEYLWTLMKNGN